MKKLILILFACFTLVFTSCDTFAQVTYSPYNGIEYEYSYNNNPVVIINGVYYWYRLIDNVWRYEMLPRPYWGYVHHIDRPRHFNMRLHNGGFTPRPHLTPNGSTRIPSSTRQTVHFGNGNSPIKRGNVGHPSNGHFGGSKGH